MVSSAANCGKCFYGRAGGTGARAKAFPRVSFLKKILTNPSKKGKLLPMTDLRFLQTKYNMTPESLSLSLLL
jgi:hypothetical protein